MLRAYGGKEKKRSMPIEHVTDVMQTTANRSNQVKKSSSVSSMLLAVVNGTAGGEDETVSGAFVFGPNGGL
jgi:hypothetical protein